MTTKFMMCSAAGMSSAAKTSTKGEVSPVTSVHGMIDMITASAAT